MKSVFEIICQIYTTSSRKEKGEIIKRNSTNENLMKYLKVSMDDYYIYGISEKTFEKILNKGEFFLTPADIGGLLSTTTEWNDSKFDVFMNSLIPFLMERQTPSLEVISELKSFFTLLNPIERYFYYRTLIKNLGINLGPKTINSAAGKMLIELYTPMLADSGNEKFESWKFNSGPLYMADTKINGLRLTLSVDKEFKSVVVKTRGNQRFFMLEDFLTANWLPLANVQESFKSFESKMPAGFLRYCIDCELQHKDKTWESSISIINTKDAAVYSDPTSDEPDFYLHCFDFVSDIPFRPENYDTDSKTEQPCKDRRANLENFIKLLQPNRANNIFKITEVLFIKDLSEVAPFAMKLISMGYEGSVVKHPDSGYICGRYPCWLKIKDIQTYDGIIIDVLPGSASGKNAELAGKILVRVEINGKEITGTCGSGFKDSDREYLWKNKEIVKGKTVEFTILGKTVKDNFQSGIFKGIRTDK